MNMTDKANEDMRKFRESLANLPMGMAKKFIEKSLESLEGESRIGRTKADKSPNKKARKLSQKSRAVNRQRSNKKSRPTGSKKRK